MVERRPEPSQGQTDRYRRGAEPADLRRALQKNAKRVAVRVDEAALAPQRRSFTRSRR